MKKIVKRACAGMFAALMAVSAMSVPSSALSVSGSVGGYSCGGSNSITSQGASAETYSGANITLSVELHYEYIDNSIDKVIELTSANSNSPVNSIRTSRSKPSGDTDSYRCYSVHNAIYVSSAGGYETWEGQTGWQRY